MFAFVTVYSLKVAKQRQPFVLGFMVRSFLLSLTLLRLSLLLLLLLLLLSLLRRNSRKTNRTMQQLLPSEVSLMIAGVDKFYKIKRMFGGIGNALSSTYSQTSFASSYVFACVWPCVWAAVLQYFWVILFQTTDTLINKSSKTLFLVNLLQTTRIPIGNH